ncbi:MAG TPA: molybdopterin-guanine dinucleotide biosynthesis protein B [Dehalococcoidia bacterium]|jgi:molybdopterin-guanine dinucleotide biosynthesis protein B|nr:molybdopterin-guanine dinucleotide biosynthesis protein B [Dehalococcoidia bacterium]
MPPIISIIGHSEVGKTSLLERLVAELRNRGYRIAVIKHVAHDFELDRPGKDSWRLARAGSSAVVLSSPHHIALLKPVERDPGLGELAQILGDDYDLILAEGFKGEPGAKIEVHRRRRGNKLLGPPSQVVAVASDEPLDIEAPCYPPNDIQGLADLIEKRFLGPDKAA